MGAAGAASVPAAGCHTDPVGRGAALSPSRAGDGARWRRVGAGVAQGPGIGGFAESFGGIGDTVFL
ncbi:MAG TPA: hypothetical protein VKY26_04010 [Actinomycetota bacterium]|nr:hypothetical protein [Actinomycetota bacterium]